MAARSVVYFAFLGGEDTDDATVSARLAYMDRQLRWLAELIALQPFRLDCIVPYTAPRHRDGEVHAAIARHGFRIDPASVVADRRNSFEYPGFLALKTLAQRSAPDDLLYYCHSKGIVQLSHGKMGMFRLHTHVGLTADLGRLEGDPALTKACLFPDRTGFCWYNFFWIKAGCMAALPVAESSNRYDFEALVADGDDPDGHRTVLPLIDRLPPDETGIAYQPWYRARETSSPQLSAAHDRYAAAGSLADLTGRLTALSGTG